MDSTPPSRRSESRLATKSASRLARIDDFERNESQLSLDLTQSSDHLSLQSSKPLALQELLLLSPSPVRRSKAARVVERPENAEEPLELTVPRRRCKSRASPMALLGCGSPRNSRRARRKLEQESREERELGLVEEIAKPRRRKQSTRSRKEKLSLVPSAPSPSLSPSTLEDDKRSLERFGQLISDLIIWKDMAKSSLWFGFGSLCFLSSCFTRDLRCSIFSGISQLSLLLMALSFFYNSLSQRCKDRSIHNFKLKEDDILRLARLILPPANLVIAKIRELFSGEPSTTLKVAPFLLFGAEYGHLMTLWRLCATGFFFSFTVPKLYSYYSMQINRQVDYLRGRVWEAWGACSHKKIVVASVVTGFWNLSSIKTRVFTAFVFVVLVRYCRQQSEQMVKEVEEEEGEQNKHEKQALVVVEQGSHLQ